MAQVSTIGVEAPPDVSPDVVPAAPSHGVILIVEDRDDVRLGLTQLLELNGFSVTDAADGERAWEYLHAHPNGFQLVLLDLLLPGAMSGIDFRARQLADPQLAAIPTVVVSACEPEIGARTSLEPVAWLEKPFRWDQLLEVVKQYVTPRE